MTLIAAGGVLHYLKSRENTQQDEALLVEDVSKHPNAWSQDGRYILFERADQ